MNASSIFIPRRRAAARLLAVVFSCALATAALSSCGALTVALPSGGEGSLRPIGGPARARRLVGPDESAQYQFDRKCLAEIGPDRSVSVLLEPSVADASFTVSISFLRASDNGKAMARNAARSAARPAARVHAVAGPLRLSLRFPQDAESDPVVGIVLAGTAEAAVDGNETPALLIRSAKIEPAWAGWASSDGVVERGFGFAGGDSSYARPRGASSLPIEPGSTLEISFASGPIGGSPARPERARFSAGTSSFSFRRGGSNRTELPSIFLDPAARSCAVLDGVDWVESLRVRYGTALPPVDEPILTDPHAALEWPRDRWRRADYEGFAWDRFPSVLIFDTADYGVQDRLFKRLAFFVEKKGYTGKLWADADLEGLHAFNAHDYRAESLAAFFEQARVENFALGAEELALRDLLLARGVLKREGSRLVPGDGAVISVSRESTEYLLYLFMAHESLHGIYFVDEGFRAKVSEVYAGMDPRAVSFLEGYFTALETLGYDVTDRYLLENEFMAYILQNPVDKVGPYFAENLRERYLRHGGDAKLANYVGGSDGADFVRAARELEGYLFSRWGMAAGRTGMLSLR